MCSDLLCLEGADLSPQTLRNGFVILVFSLLGQDAVVLEASGWGGTWVVWLGLWRL